MDSLLDLIARDIIAHLDRHPGAADTVGGIRRWWLRVELRDQPDCLVQQALDRLGEEAVVVARSIGDGSVVYSRGPRPEQPS